MPDYGEDMGLHRLGLEVGLGGGWKWRSEVKIEVTRGWSYTHSKLAPQLKKAEFRQPKNSIMGSKQACLIFALEGDIIFIILKSKDICDLLEGKTISLSFKDILCTNILENIMWN